jgi:hypothetical protein
VQPPNYCRWYQQFWHLESIWSQQRDLIDKWQVLMLSAKTGCQIDTVNSYLLGWRRGIV